jgi:chemotaxis methyl-accepting protein methylase
MGACLHNVTGAQRTARPTDTTGEVVALERSKNFVHAMEQRCRAHSLENVRIHELDLMTDELSNGAYDFSWCRLIVAFFSASTESGTVQGTLVRNNSIELRA